MMLNFSAIKSHRFLFYLTKSRFYSYSMFKTNTSYYRTCIVNWWSTFCWSEHFRIHFIQQEIFFTNEKHMIERIKILVNMGLDKLFDVELTRPLSWRLEKMLTYLNGLFGHHIIVRQTTAGVSLWIYPLI